MHNKVYVPNPKREIIKLAAILLLASVLIAIIVLFTYRALDTRNYNGRVREVSGIVTNIEQDDEDTLLTLDSGAVYNANRLSHYYPDFHLDSLLNQQVTFILPEKQVGGDAIEPWIVGIKQGDDTLVIDYLEVIAKGKAEAKTAMIISGVVAGVLGIAAIALLLWRAHISPTKEVDLYEAYCEFSRQRQPNCPQYKYLNVAVLIFLGVMAIVLIAVAIVCSLVEVLAVQIAVAVAMCVIFAGCIVALFVYANKLVQKEREFYAQNFPFNLDDISSMPAYGNKQKQFKAKMQEDILEERKNFPHRFYDAGNAYAVDFTEKGVDIYNEDSAFLAPDLQLDYRQLNFEALPYYRKKDHPLTVIVKSRITDSIDLPKDMENDLHFILDTNLLATLRSFDVDVENLQQILDNKAQLIQENCMKNKTNI